jgi:hypothetical protein
MKSKFPKLEKYLKNGVVDKGSKYSIGIIQGSDTRSTGNLAIGGIDCTVVRMLPVNIKLRWGDNQQGSDDMSIDIYNKLLLQPDNFMIGDVKIAYIEMLDGCPINLGRDDKNVCESIIRANFYYYV